MIEGSWKGRFSPKEIPFCRGFQAKVLPECTGAKSTVVHPKPIKKPLRRETMPVRSGSNPTMKPLRPVQILLVEDKAGDILLMRQALAGERIPISIHVAVDGEQAVEMLSRRHFDPDLVILDLTLPKRDGISVLEETPPGVPVVVFTSSTDPEHRKDALDLGALEYIQKPSDLDEYTGVVSQMVRHWAVPRDC
jgi:CheY-like chemotaxis protein